MTEHYDGDVECKPCEFWYKAKRTTGETPTGATCRCSQAPQPTKCKGAAPGTGFDADKCYPQHIWSGTLYSGSSYHGIAFNESAFTYPSCGTGYCPGTLAFTVRCLLFALSCGALCRLDMKIITSP